MGFEKIIYAKAEKPAADASTPVMLTDETMRCRKEKILTAMHKKGLDKLIIYEDEQHYGNFAYCEAKRPDLRSKTATFRF